jgi:hypothetical protein
MGSAGLQSPLSASCGGVTEYYRFAGNWHFGSSSSLTKQAFRPRFRDPLIHFPLYTARAASFGADTVQCWFQLQAGNGNCPP